MTTTAPTRPQGRLPFDRGMLCRQLASMLRSGLPLPQALAFLSEEFRPEPRRLLSEARRRVEDGAPLSEALGALPERWMSAQVRAAVAAGERSGKLPEVLDALAEDDERLRGFESRLRGIFLYPLSVLLLSLLVVGLVVSRVLPTFASLYAQLHRMNPAAGVSLPFGTRLLDWTWTYLGLPIVILVGLVILWLLWGLRDRSVPVVPSVLWRPLVRFFPPARAIRDATSEMRFARGLSLLAGSGVPVPQALELCEKLVGDEAQGQALSAASKRIQGGEAPSAVLADLPFLSPVFLYFLSGTELRGDFIEVTQTMADASEELLTSRLEMALRVVEPASILALGAFMGFVVVHFYWPIFELSRHVGY